MKPGLNKYVSLVIISIVWGVLPGCSTTTQSSSGSAPSTITYQTFYDDLSPYGTWIDYPGYSHVWCPAVGIDFRPYSSNGHWVYTYEGWTWVSGYNWGWAPFHFGRWLYDDMYGWLWVPGYEWAPAWVTWGYVGDDYCWAPLTPGVGVNMSFYTWRPHDIYWNYCNKEHINSAHLSQYIERSQNVTNITNEVTIINHFSTTNVNKNYYAQGPVVSDVEKYTKQTISPVAIESIDRIPDAKRREEMINAKTEQQSNAAKPEKRDENIKINSSGTSTANPEMHPGKAAIPFYRPKVVQPVTPANQGSPRPKVYSEIEHQNIRPVFEMNDKPVRTRPEQIDNVQRLPRMIMPNPTIVRPERRRG